MPRRCIVAGCSKTKPDNDSLHSVPFKNSKTLDKKFKDEPAKLEMPHGA